MALVLAFFRNRQAIPRLAAFAGLCIANACGPQPPVVVTATPAPASQPTPASNGARRDTTDVYTSPVINRPPKNFSGWRVDAREHVDLWMHGYAMLMDDPSLVPSFAPAYRATIAKARGGTTTFLDANRDRLLKRLGENPNLASAQFLVFYFASWDDLKRGTDRFLRDRGDVRAARTNDEVRMYATLRTYFSTPEDRDWLQLFVASLDDERAKFYHAYWLQQGQQLAGVRGRVEQLWRGTYQAAFGRFMRGAMQKDGYLLLSFPLGGEGRTIAVGQRDNFVAVPFPASADAANEAFYAAAHEVVGSTANSAVHDNASAAETRTGDAAKWQTLAAVRGGAMMLARVAPDLVDGYMRYYLRLARVPNVTVDVAARFATTFPLPDRIRDALQAEIDAVLGGI